MDQIQFFFRFFKLFFTCVCLKWLINFGQLNFLNQNFPLKSILQCIKKQEFSCENEQWTLARWCVVLQQQKKLNKYKEKLNDVSLYSENDFWLDNLCNFDFGKFKE